MKTGKVINAHRPAQARRAFVRAGFGLAPMCGGLHGSAQGLGVATGYGRIDPSEDPVNPGEGSAELT